MQPLDAFGGQIARLGLEPGGCSVTASGYPTCLTDAQLRTELAKLIGANSLPLGTGAKAPIYMIVTPQTINVCDDGSGQ